VAEEEPRIVFGTVLWGGEPVDVDSEHTVSVIDVRVGISLTQDANDPDYQEGVLLLQVQYICQDPEECFKEPEDHWMMLAMPREGWNEVTHQLAEALKQAHQGPGVIDYGNPN
jgi:hypothetical protein